MPDEPIFGGYDDDPATNGKLEREGGLDEISQFNGELLDELLDTTDEGDKIADEAERFLKGQ